MKSLTDTDERLDAEGALLGRCWHKLAGEAGGNKAMSEQRGRRKAPLPCPNLDS